MKNLNFNYNQIKFLETDKQTLFVFENFLNETDYLKIRENLPVIKNTDLNNDYFLKKKTSNINGKFRLSPNNNIYDEIILKNKILNIVHKEVFNTQFIKKIFSIFNWKILLARKSDFSYFLKLLIRKNRFVLENKKKKITEKLLFNNIFPAIEFSYMFNKSKIVPHTDSRSKLISLMLYFPDDQLTNEEISELGTTFYDCDKKNLLNKHINNLNAENEFQKKYDKLTTLPFKGRNLYGFIRTEKSWHAVEKINKKNDFVRRSININLLFN